MAGEVARLTTSTDRQYVDRDESYHTDTQTHWQTDGQTDSQLTAVHSTRRLSAVSAARLDQRVVTAAVIL